MNFLDRLKQTTLTRSALLNKISNDFKETEAELKRLAFPSFEYECKGGMKLRWETFDRRLVVTSEDGSLNRPIIEAKVHIREALHPYLPEFCDAILEANGYK